MIKKFEHEMEDFRQRLIEMGEVTETMLAAANKAILNLPHQDGYNEVMAAEKRLDRMQLEISQKVVRTLTVFGPVAVDLRFVMMTSRIASQLERIGDQVVNICETLQLIDTQSSALPFPRLVKLSRVVGDMVRDAHRAFVDSDAGLARSTIAVDDLADALNDQIIAELLSDDAIHNALEGPSDIGDAMAQVIVARSLERVADQATNICEEIIYLVKGHDVRHERQSPENLVSLAN